MTDPARPDFHAEGESNTSAARADWATRTDDDATRALLDRDADAFLHQSLSSPCVATIAKAQGIWIEDTAGRRYMDFHGNSVHHIGYGHPRLIQAIKDQLDALSFSPRRFANEVSTELAERLGALAPWPAKVLFTTGGSDAIEVALKIARAATGRFKTLSFWDAFHGAGFGAASVGGEADVSQSDRRAAFAGGRARGTVSLLSLRLRPPWPCVLRTCLRKLWSTLFWAAKATRPSVIGEPMRAVPVVPPQGYWRAVETAARAHGALLIMDEIPTGLGKTGRFFAHEHDVITPDIIVIGKALGGGTLPIAAVIARADLDVAGDFAIGHYTHEKNPVTARAALTTLDIIQDQGLVDRSARLGAKAMDRLREDAGSQPPGRRHSRARTDGSGWKLSRIAIPARPIRIGPSKSITPALPRV